MKKKELRILQARYESKRRQRQKDFREFEKLRRTFVRNYPVSVIRNLSVDEYVVGKGKDTFCNQLEIKLDSLGRIKGSYSPKFGIWYGHFGKNSLLDYRHTKKFGSSLSVAFNAVIDEIIDLLKLGKIQDYEALSANRISPMFRGKLLFVYHPKSFLNIYSDSHLDHFISHLDLCPESDNAIYKQKALLDFKNNDTTMKVWSVFEFGAFLYDAFKAPLSEADLTNSKRLDKFAEETYPPLNQVNWEVVNMELAKSSAKKTTSKAKKGKVKKGREAAHKRLGDRGEKIALLAEKARMRRLKLKPSLVKHVAEKNDYLGYDILSVETDDKTPRYIEVKSTRSAPGEGQFFISSNELARAGELDNYCIYLVYKADTPQPKVVMLEDPMGKKNKSMLNIEPSQYRVGYRLDKIARDS